MLPDSTSLTLIFILYGCFIVSKKKKILSGVDSEVEGSKRNQPYGIKMSKMLWILQRKPVILVQKFWKDSVLHKKW